MRLSPLVTLAMLAASLGTAAVGTATLARADTPAPTTAIQAAATVGHDLSETVARLVRTLSEGGSRAAAEKPAPAARTSEPAQPITDAPAPNGQAITGAPGMLPPSEQLAGRQAALRFRFQQQMQSGERPWLPRTLRD